MTFNKSNVYFTESSLASAVSNLYIQVNGRLVKKIDLITLRDEQEEEESETNPLLTSLQVNSLNDDLTFDYANISEIIMDEIERAGRQQLNTHAFIRVKLMSKLSGSLATANSTRERQELRKMFAHVDEQLALHVKFGSPAHRNKPTTETRRFRRHANSHHSSRKHSSSKSTKSYRECADLRGSGYTRANISCCRETISFTMEQIGWSHWILSPKVIEYKYCRGGCLSMLIFLLRIQSFTLFIRIYLMIHFVVQISRKLAKIRKYSNCLQNVRTLSLVRIVSLLQHLRLRRWHTVHFRHTTELSDQNGLA